LDPSLWLRGLHKNRVLWYNPAHLIPFEEEEEVSQPEETKSAKPQYREKPEKQEEKDEKGRQEKNFDEKWRRDPLNSAAWALILIWAGLVLLASNLGVFQSIEAIREWWPIFFLGAGVILLLEVGFRLLVPAYRGPLVGTLILAVVFLAVGSSQLGLENIWDFIWPIGLVALGLLILTRGLLRRRQ
jgi:hypothetical protein